jgi:hypothetical protein
MLEPFGLTLSIKDGSPVISLSSHLKHYVIQGANGEKLGDLYGLVLHSYHGEGIKIDGNIIKLSQPLNDIHIFERDILSHLHGNFIIHTHSTLPDRVYPDCGGSIPIVYCAETQRAGSSASMFLSETEYEKRFAKERHKAIIENEVSGSWISGFLTAHHGILRLLPNYYLDLQTWSAHRFWPIEDDFALNISLSDAVQNITRALQGFTKGVSDEYKTGVTATAGFDSRLLIAACKGLEHQTELFTFGKEGQGIDQYTPRLLAQKLGLKHVLIPVLESTEEEKIEWDRLVSDVVRESTRNFFPTLKQLDYDIILTGMYGETGRCRLYRQDFEIINEKPATAEFVLSRLTLPLHPDVVESVNEWLSSISKLPRSAVLDLAFNELRFGNWAMAQAPVQKSQKIAFMPFAQRIIQDAFMRVPPTEKTTDVLFTELGKALWPEAMDFPINKYGDYRDYLSPLLKRINKDSFIRFWRDRFA